MYLHTDVHTYVYLTPGELACFKIEVCPFTGCAVVPSYLNSNVPGHL